MSVSNKAQKFISFPPEGDQCWLSRLMAIRALQYEISTPQWPAYTSTQKIWRFVAHRSSWICKRDISECLSFATDICFKKCFMRQLVSIALTIEYFLVYGFSLLRYANSRRPWSLIVVVILTIMVEFVARVQQTWLLENTLEKALKKWGKCL